MFDDFEFDLHRDLIIGKQVGSFVQSAFPSGFDFVADLGGLRGKFFNIGIGFGNNALALRFFFGTDDFDNARAFGFGTFTRSADFLENLFGFGFDFVGGCPCQSDFALQFGLAHRGLLLNLFDQQVFINGDFFDFALSFGFIFSLFTLGIVLRLGFFKVQLLFFLGGFEIFLFDSNLVVLRDLVAAFFTFGNDLFQNRQAACVKRVVGIEIAFIGLV